MLFQKYKHIIGILVVVGPGIKPETPALPTELSRPMSMVHLAPHHYYITLFPSFSHFFLLEISLYTRLKKPLGLPVGFLVGCKITKQEMTQKICEWTRNWAWDPCISSKVLCPLCYPGQCPFATSPLLYVSHMHQWVHSKREWIRIWTLLTSVLIKMHS